MIALDYLTAYTARKAIAKTAKQLRRDHMPRYLVQQFVSCARARAKV